MCLRLHWSEHPCECLHAAGERLRILALRRLVLPEPPTNRPLLVRIEFRQRSQQLLLLDAPGGFLAGIRACRVGENGAEISEIAIRVSVGSGH